MELGGNQLVLLKEKKKLHQHLQSGKLAPDSEQAREENCPYMKLPARILSYLVKNWGKRW